MVEGHGEGGMIVLEGEAGPGVHAHDDSSGQQLRVLGAITHLTGNANALASTSICVQPSP